MVRVHRDKLFKALDMLANGKTTREVANEKGLSFTQLKEIRRTSEEANKRFEELLMRMDERFDELISSITS